ncbi:MAG TPA: hypothetical protein VK766_05505 [Cytophagaceae bacterium]|nr:hypothetical protein [Cytophagaceae bacterium]
MALDSLSEVNNKLTKGYLKYDSLPDGYGEFSLKTFTSLYKAEDTKTDSLILKVGNLLSTTTKYKYPDFLERGFWKMSFNNKNSKYDSTEQVGIFHISDLVYYNKGESSMLYFGYRCGNECSEGFIIEYFFDLNENKWKIKKLIPVWTSYNR